MDLRTSDRYSIPVSRSPSAPSSGSSQSLTSSSGVTAAATCNQSQGKKCINRQSQKCSVCGDRAFYVFYGAISCDSCRTFFRRQVLHSKDLNCHFSNSCQIQQNTRKDCASCRLDKCLAVGMRKSLVAVGEAETSRTACCRSSALPQPAAAANPLSRSKSACEIPHVPASHPPHVSETRAPRVTMLRKTGERTGASFPLFPDSRSDNDVVVEFSRPRLTSHSPDDYHCHPELSRNLFSRIPRDNFLSMVQAGDGNTAASQISLQGNCLSSLERDKPITYTQCIRKETVTGREVSRVPILEQRLTQPRPPPKVAHKQEHSALSQEKQSVWQGSTEKRAMDYGDPMPLTPEPATAPRKLVHPKFRRSPPASLTVNIGRDPERSQVIHVTGLSSTERMRFIEIMNAMRSIETGVGSNFRKQTEEIRLQEKETSFVPLVILVCAKTLLRFAEKLAVFPLLPRQDKEVLLKGSLTEILFLRSAKFFSRSGQCWIFGPGNSTSVIPEVVPINVLRVAGEEIYDKYTQFVTTFSPDVYDDVISNLMSVICFFTERGEHLVQKSHIRSERSLYLRLLNRYLEAKYAAGSKLSPADVFAKIQEKFDELTTIKEMYEQSNVDLENIDQLVLNYQQMRLGSSPPLADESLCHEDGQARAHPVTSPS